MYVEVPISATQSSLLISHMVTISPRGPRTTGATGPNRFLLDPVERDTSGRREVRVISHISKIVPKSSAFRQSITFEMFDSIIV
jgi:hypothetical protein